MWLSPLIRYEGISFRTECHRIPYKSDWRYRPEAKLNDQLECH
jgi:hypothetical protein